jgi:hypothetical protein
MYAAAARIYVQILEIPPLGGKKRLHSLPHYIFKNTKFSSEPSCVAAREWRARGRRGNDFMLEAPCSEPASPAASPIESPDSKHFRRRAMFQQSSGAELEAFEPDAKKLGALLEELHGERQRRADAVQELAVARKQDRRVLGLLGGGGGAKLAIWPGDS